MAREMKTTNYPFDLKLTWILITKYLAIPETISMYSHLSAAITGFLMSWVAVWPLSSFASKNMSIIL